MAQQPAQEHFKEAAPGWDNPERQQMIESFAKSIRLHLARDSGLRVLDVGCGTGLLSGGFLGNGNQILGIDTSDDMLAVFRSKFGGRSDIRCLAFNLEESELCEGPFDLVVSSMAFHHLERPEALLKKLKALLSPSGAIAVIDLDQEDGSFHPDAVKMGVRHFGFSRKTIEEWASKIGFAKFEYELIFTIEKESGKFPIFLAVFKA